MRYKQIVDMARQAGAWPELSETPVKDVAFLKRFAELVFEQGRQEGMKQERALWTLTKVGQEIEAQRPWAGLTEKERNALLPLTITHSAIEFGKAIEAKLKEKNA
jgi:hypothetical protein